MAKATRPAASPRPQLLTSGPWKSVYNSSDSSESYQDHLYAASNCYKPKGGSSFAMRPPFVVQKAAGVLGTVTSRYGQQLFEHVAEDGTFYRFLFVGGKVYRWDGASAYADVTPATVTISDTAPIYATSFGDNLAVHDGTNQPWYVPSSGCAATPLVATKIPVDSVPTAWVAWGPMAVFDGKLFFTLLSIGGTFYRDTIVWSEIASPATGYKQSGFANFWELFQTDPHPISGIAATEISLVVLRAQSMLNITGKTDQTFTTNATRESIEGVGTTTPQSIAVHNGAVWFLDEQGRQYRYQPGSAPEPVWTQMADTVSAKLSTALMQSPPTAASITYHPDLNLMCSVSYAGSTGTSNYANQIHVFDADSGLYYGTWDVDGLKLIHTIGVMHTDSGYYSLLVLGENTTGVSSPTTGGQLWRQRTLGEANLFNWADPSGVPTTSVTTHHLGRNEEGEWFFTLLTLRAIENNAAAIPLTYYTTRGSSTPPAAVLSKPPTTPVNSAISGFEGEGRAVWGLGPNAQGRWLMATVSAPTASQSTPPFTPTAIELVGILTRANPQAP